MTVAAIIEQFNTERPNQTEDNLKIDWLKKCERAIIDRIIIRHEDAPTDEELEEHIKEFGMSTELLIDEPYEEIYTLFMDMKVSFNSNEIERYNIAAELYNNAFLNFQQKYNREHKAINKRNNLIRHEVL